MKNILVLSGAGIGLFVGSLIGLLAALGRLDHEGTKGIPVIASLFPAPEEDPDAQVGESHGDGSHPDGDAEGHSSTSDPAHGGGDPAHGGGDPAHGGGDTGDGSHDAETGYEIGPSPLAEVEEKGGGGGHGGGGGEEAAAGHEGDGEHEDGNFRKVHPKAGEVDGETHHRRLQESLYQTNYEPGGYFDFHYQKVGARLSPEQINALIARAKETEKQSHNREKALEERERQLADRERDVARRHEELAELKQELIDMEKALDARIQSFRAQVDIIRNAERDNLNELAKSLGNIDTEAAADYVAAQWRSGALGQSQVLKVLRTMKAGADDILAVLPSETRRDILNRRLQLGEEPPEEGGR